MSLSAAERLNRWRLVLGKYSQESLGFSDAGVAYQEMDDLLDFLYGREYDEERGIRKEGGSQGSQLTVPSWIANIRKLFPKRAVEILEKHALDKYQLVELLTDKETLERLAPNQDLLKNILQFKHLLQGEALESARKIVKTVADEIREKLETSIRAAIFGRLNRHSTGYIRSIRNLDVKKTIRKNLKNYDRANRRLLVENFYFNNRIQSFNPWHVIILVDESGSMLDSVIYSAIMAGIFARLPMLSTRLVIFDTNVVDLSGYLEDPVQTLMSIRLGGGTDIAKALAYAQTLFVNPHKTIVVLVTDLFEGGGYDKLYRRTVEIIESGAKLIALTALNVEAEPVYDRKAAEKMTALGAEVAALTPDRLADWIGKIIS